MKPIDLSKFQKDLKKMDRVSTGFHDPKYWVSTKSYALNYLISGDFKKGIPMGKVTMLAGESGCLPDTSTVIIDDKEVTIKELRALLKVGDKNDVDISTSDISISTPDGNQKLIRWFNKGKLEMVRVEAENGLVTECAVNHMIQIESLEQDWCPAENLTDTHVVLTRLGPSKIKSVEKIDDQVCYDFTVDHKHHRYWGDGFSSHNSGKSFIASGNIAASAQEQGFFVVMIDSENALDSDWLEALGVSTDPDKLLKMNVTMIDDVAKLINNFVKEYKSEWADKSRDERPKVLFIIDSLGMLLSPTDVSQFEDGNLKGDMGRKPKALAALVRNCVNTFGEWDMGLVATNHSYASQDMFAPDPVISGGQGFIYASSIVLAMQKMKLKEDEDGNKISDVTGIRSKARIMKTRYNKPFETCELKIPYETGLDPYSGLIEFFEKRGYFVKDGNKLRYTDMAGNDHKYFRKQISHELLDQMMEEFIILEEQKAKAKKENPEEQAMFEGPVEE